MNLERIKAVGTGAAYKGGEVLRSFLGKIDAPGHKGVIDLVTEADIASERILIETIHRAFPDHGILAEESGDNGKNPECRWVIDPLDGTTNFTHQVGQFAVSIAFELEGVVEVGVVLNPVSGELFTAVRGEGAYLNGRPIRVSKTLKVLDSLLVTGFPYQLKEIVTDVMSRFSACQQASQGVRRFGAAALDLCFVACGRFDGFWEQNLKPWDTAAGFRIAKEAGACVTNFSNDDFSVDGMELLATNGCIHTEMLELLLLNR